MLKLGVNIDHVATVREARYRGRTAGEPDPIQAAIQCEAAGAHGITAHLREDRRHMLDRDIERLRERISTRLNLEMANTPEMAEIAARIRPNTVCVVPERREEVTTEGGLDVQAHETSLAELRRQLNGSGIEVSLFIAPDPEQVKASSRVGAQSIELHTGSYAEAFHDKSLRDREIQRLVESARLAHGLGIRVNAGHGLTVPNVPPLFVVPHMEELNIGHSIISRALFVGLTAAVKEMLAAMAGYPGTPG
jgi:pyridoxine 5-phosphate synthase